ncbi:hypothetical protein NIES267_01530 [Calothrix parasitica NIES-267]|uniref:Uncharacterized protein n=1 Tax=Calothrix parasitica NIES-267 TaxID=1973488 RepID=A0A1Z4LHI0_9CYAN|nr:hypothetical protein NIES267_01530 [Calothrix parasitica NIES-267]
MAHQSSAHINNFPEISQPEQLPLDITTSFSELLLPEQLATDYNIGNKSNSSLKILSDAATKYETENDLLFPIVDKNIDEKSFDIDLNEIKDISETPLSKKNPKVETTLISRPPFHRSGNYSIASASASVRVVNSPNIVSKSFTKSAGVKPTQAIDSQDLKIIDDLPAIDISERPKITSEIKQILKNSKNTALKLSEKKIDDLDKADSNLVSEKSNDVSVVKTDFHKTNNYSDDNSHDYSIKVNITNNLENGVVASPSYQQFENLFYLGQNEHAVGSEANDIFFVQPNGGNILSGGAGSDQFWIVNGQIPESANIIVDFEIGSDVIGIIGSSSLGINPSTLELNEIDGNTEINFDGQILAVINNVTGLDITKSFIFS